MKEIDNIEEAVTDTSSDLTESEQENVDNTEVVALAEENQADELNSEDEPKDENETQSEGDDKKSGKKKKKKKTVEDMAYRGRYRYYRDYVYRDVPTKNGKTKRRKVYEGAYYSFAVPHDYRKDPKRYVNKLKWRYGLVTLLMVALAIAGGVIDTAGLGNQMIVVVPYVVTFATLAFVAFSVIEFVFTKSTQYEQVVADSLSKSLRVKTIVIMIGAGMTAVCQLLCMLFIDKSMLNLKEGLLSAIMALMCGAALYFLKLQDCNRLEKVKKKQGK